MHSHARWALGAAVAAVLLSPATTAVQSRDGEAGANWTYFGGDMNNTRYSSLSQINAQNVKTLGGAWTIKFEGGATTRATPVVKDGVMYISAGTRLSALNAKTGATLWAWQPAKDAPQRLETANIGDLINAGVGVPNPPGVSLGDGMVFVGLMDGSVAALNEKTGQAVWTQKIGYEIPKVGEAVSGTPAYANGIVFTGLANGDWAFRGKAVALDAKTGRMLWQFNTIPDPGQPGHDSWPLVKDEKYGDVYKQGGAGVWHPPAVDPELGLVYYVQPDSRQGESRHLDYLRQQRLHRAHHRALDGTFETGRLKMAESTSLKILKPGTYRYACKEHPWSIGELIIE
jgi:quinohemoprotein ethanol dehydrogenase